MALVSAVILGILHNTTTHYLIIIHPFYFFNTSPEISSAYVISFIGNQRLHEAVMSADTISMYSTLGHTRGKYLQQLFSSLQSYMHIFLFYVLFIQDR